MSEKSLNFSSNEYSTSTVKFRCKKFREIGKGFVIRSGDANMRIFNEIILIFIYFNDYTVWS